jgi:hypothetical protein
MRFTLSEARPSLSGRGQPDKHVANLGFLHRSARDASKIFMSATSSNPKGRDASEIIWGHFGTRSLMLLNGIPNTYGWSSAFD